MIQILDEKARWETLRDRLGTRAANNEECVRPGTRRTDGGRVEKMMDKKEKDRDHGRRKRLCKMSL